MIDRGSAQVLAVIAIGGMLGAAGRYGIGLALPTPDSGYPWATFFVNISGCLLIGVLMVIIDLGLAHRLIRPFVGVGILGGYTTFSTYTVETQSLLASGHPELALGYLFGTAAAALAAVAVGVAGTRALTHPPTSGAGSA